MPREAPGENAQHVAECILKLIMLLSRGHCGAVFCIADGEPTLLASRSIHQESLVAGMRVWSTCGKELMAESGPVYLPGALAIPLAMPDRGHGYLYIDEPNPGFRLPAGECAALAGVLGRAAASVTVESGGSLPALGLEWSVDPDCAELMALLDREEWNIARVARRLGVQRQTVYNRLKKHNIPRQRIPKSVSKPRWTPKTDH